MATLLGTWLTVREVAQHLKAPERTIRHWITHGTGSPLQVRLAAVKFGRSWRVTQTDLRRFEEQCCQ